jgi:hypothetical protein
MAIERAVISTISPCYNLLQVHIELELRRRVVTGNLKTIKKLANKKNLQLHKIVQTNPLGRLL